MANSSSASMVVTLTLTGFGILAEFALCATNLYGKTAPLCSRRRGISEHTESYSEWRFPMGTLGKIGLLDVLPWPVCPMKLRVM